MSDAPAAIVTRRLSKTFQRGAVTTTALDAIDLTVTRGEFVSIVGPSGCGKSTLLRLIAGLLRPSAGDVMTNGHAVVRPVTDLVLRLGTWIAWNRKTTEDPALLAALTRVREQCPATEAGAVVPEPARR